MLDSKTGNLFLRIFSVGVQCHNVFLRVQKGPWVTRQADIKSQKARRRPYGWTDR